MRNERSRRTNRRRAIWSITIAVAAVLVLGAFGLMRQIYVEETGDAAASGTELGVAPTRTAAPTEAPATEVPAETPTEAPAATPAPTVTAKPTPAPTPGPLYALKIGIDPGHQQKMNSEKEPVAPGSSEMKPKVASGTQGVQTRIEEYETDLRISMALKARLESLGAEVLMTRETNDVNISNVERAEMMNDWDADLVLRIHCNGVDSKKTHGIGLYVKKTGAQAKESYEAAVAIMPEMLAATGAREDGIFKRDVYSGLNWSKVPSILVECGYMSNPEEDVMLNDPEYQKQLADGMAKGVARYFDRGEMPEMTEMQPAAASDVFEDYVE